MTAQHSPFSKRGAAPNTVRFTDPDELRAVSVVLKRSRREIESVVTGSSMGRTMPDGSRILIRCNDTLDWKPGTVIAFFAGPTLVAHRIVARGIGTRARSFWVTRGDGTLISDVPVNGDAVLGEVIAWSPEKGWHGVPDPPPTPLGRLAVSKCIELVTRITLEIHPRLAGRVAIGLTKLTQFARRLLPD